MGSESYHEPIELLSTATREMHRAIVSLIEELEAIDWYTQRAEAATDDELRAVLIHNRDEEIEHACMTLEWIRRRHTKFDEELRNYLFSNGPITAREEGAGDSGETGPAPDTSLGIGSLKENRR